MLPWRRGAKGGPNTGEKSISRTSISQESLNYDPNLSDNPRSSEVYGSGRHSSQRRVARSTHHFPSYNESRNRYGNRNRRNHDYVDNDPLKSYQYPKDDGVYKRGRGSSFRNTRKYPIGYRKLESLLSFPPDEVVLELLKENSGFSIFIAEVGIRDELIVLLVKVIARATKTNSNKINMLKLLSVTFCHNICHQLISFCVKIINLSDHSTADYFRSLQEICDCYITMRPFDALKSIKGIVGASIMALKCKGTEFVGFISKFESIQKIIDDTEKQIENKCPIAKRKYWLDRNEEPPEDFRELSVVPTIQDITQNDRPFVRKNVVSGRYMDVNHYLDVQFRLLREDFVRPLREGIAEYLQNVKRNSSLRIYRNVELRHLELVQRELVYYFKLTFSPRFKVENSKNLLFGNLVCFSSDGFKTIIFGHIFDRNIEHLKEGLIGIKFDNVAQLPLPNIKYVMGETKAYFVAYKHVLEALQRVCVTKLPFPHYFVEVSKEILPPEYLSPVVYYNMTKMFETALPYDYNKLICNLQSVRVLAPLDEWPSADIMGLDESQRRALHGALTRQLAIIQGPPGTGKTFLGLKITEILLGNMAKTNFLYDHREVGHEKVVNLNRNSTLIDQGPILVVCYTNHALDQFLEGIANFTRKIVRIGSRTKSELIETFNVNNIIRKYHFPSHICHLKETIYYEVKTLDESIQILQNNIKHLAQPIGIHTLAYVENAIPDWALSQFEQMRNPYILSQWLLEPDSSMNFTESEMKHQNEEKLSVKEGNEAWHDALELMEREEADRLLSDFDCNFESKISIDLNDLYDITISDLKDLILQFQNEIEFEGGATSSHYNMINCSMQLDILTYGLDLGRNDKEFNPVDIFAINLRDRWLLYNSWIYKTKLIKIEEFKKQAQVYEDVSTRLTEMKYQEYLHVMRNSDVIGITTTAAAKFNPVIQALAPKIVIIEEAAEILEAHIVTSLTSSCNHLILIGDHQQLRPNTSVYELATKYGLDMSLFERMIKNGIMYETLLYQHRMRPEISSLIVPSVYAELKDHISVSKYNHILGITKDVFFINHHFHEKNETDDDNNSHENEFEASFMTALSRHIILQGYNPNQITILTPYSGQFFLLKKLQRNHYICSEVKICIVDNFQGEENDIILLSLVRSNDSGSVGFLKIENRVCVALSRAKKGFYIIGNMDQLCQASKLWLKINATLQNHQNIGNVLELECLIHPGEYTHISKGEDFIDKCPEGGCLKVCGTWLDCGHICPRTCHILDKHHLEFKCLKPCSRSICESGHPCPKKCYEECSDCFQLVEKTLPCGHEAMVHCYLDPKDFKCKESIERILPDCQHKNKTVCSIDMEKYQCSYPCEIRLDCGHECKRNCHVNDDPEHDEFQCLESCDLLNKGCVFNHPCNRICYEECAECVYIVDKTLACGHTHSKVQCHVEITCSKKCNRMLTCGHHCQNICSEECEPCEKFVEKIIPICNHKAKVMCHEDPNESHCSGPCPKILPCGHNCKEKCKEKCTANCPAVIQTEELCPKKHNISMPCHKKGTVEEDALLLLCQEPCQSILSCGHRCRGKCGQCLSGRLHEVCREPCKRPLVCGHLCKAGCSEECPPCLSPCEFKCSHNKCARGCAIPCKPCKSKCRYICEHRKCNKKCGQPCETKPCEEPCQKTLQKCGHDCVGFCGEPCPKLCRICDFVELCTDFTLLGYEEDDDSRFVVLVDCGHSIESRALDQWMQQEIDEIGVKKCPKCQTPIYNTNRYKDVIIRVNKDIDQIKYKYFSTAGGNLKRAIWEELEDVDIEQNFAMQRNTILNIAKIDLFGSTSRKKKVVPDVVLQVCLFKARVLHKLANLQRTKTFNIRNDLSDNVKILLKFLLKKVMNVQQKLPFQFSVEISCELRRLAVLPAVERLEKEYLDIPELARIRGQIKTLMDPSIKFDEQLEAKVLALLKDSEPYVGGLGLTDEERIQVVSAMGFKQGHWYKCPNGHIYCIANCGGAVSEAVCPTCKAKIGGTSYTLNAGNTLATEMDGAVRGAYDNRVVNY